jgi:hypothetical protein
MRANDEQSQHQVNNARHNSPSIRAAFSAICAHNALFGITGCEQAQLDALLTSLQTYASFKGLDLSKIAEVPNPRKCGNNLLDNARAA